MTEMHQEEKNPWVALVVIIAFCLMGLFVFQFLGLAILIPILGESFSGLISIISNPYNNPDYKWVIIFIQAVVSIGAFIAAPLYFIWRHDNKRFDYYFNSKNFKIEPALVTVFLVISFMIVNSLFIEWNMNFQFPEFMSGFGDWARDKEDQLEQLTQYITTFDSWGYFMFVFLVVAVLPGIGEELLFRGLIQNQILKISGNIHIAVWASAIFFSAFHMQFFGFVPRLLLGAFFGYLYVFSGNLWYAILAHFVNNGFTLLMVYLYQNSLTGYDIENVNSVPLMSVALAFVISSVLFYLFYKQVNSEHKPTDE